MVLDGEAMDSRMRGNDSIGRVDCMRGNDSIGGNDCMRGTDSMHENGLVWTDMA
jgi:hypothetical protein